jgi:hypothetical protein
MAKEHTESSLSSVQTSAGELYEVHCHGSWSVVVVARRVARERAVGGKGALPADKAGRRGQLIAALPRTEVTSRHQIRFFKLDL